jgi:hypothetical protein
LCLRHKKNDDAIIPFPDDELCNPLKNKEPTPSSFSFVCPLEIKTTNADSMIAG